MSEAKQSAEIPELTALTKSIRCATCGARRPEHNEWQWKYCKFKRSQDIEEIRNLLKVTERWQRYSEVRCDLLESYLSEIIENRERIAALDAIRKDLMEKSSGLLGALRTCHYCGADLELSRANAYCEDCPAGCEAHDPPDCRSLEDWAHDLDEALARSQKLDKPEELPDETRP